jgi:predicted YcjX-like family ATPase
MKLSKLIFADSEAEALLDFDREERQLALEYVAEAWNAAEGDGVDTAALAHASLFAALTTLVDAHGEEAAADLVAALPERIRCGEYSLKRVLQ